MFRWLILGISVVVADQVSKLFADRLLTFGEPMAIMPSLNLTLLYNRGAAFSFLSDETGWQMWFFIVVTVVVVVFLFRWLLLLGKNEQLSAVALILIISGAIGNLIDRVVYGYVIDFIDIYYESWHWPVFNLADSAITIGAIMLLIAINVEKKKDIDYF